MSHAVFTVTLSGRGFDRLAAAGARDVAQLPPRMHALTTAPTLPHTPQVRVTWPSAASAAWRLQRWRWAPRMRCASCRRVGKGALLWNSPSMGRWVTKHH